MNAALQNEIKRLQEIARQSRRGVELLGRLAKLAADDAFESALDYGSGVQFHVTPKNAAKAVRAVLVAFRQQTAKKSFEESLGEVRYTIPHPDGVYGAIVIKAGPPTRCKMELVEEDVVVPAQPARVERKKRYRLVDPACLDGEVG